MIRERALLLRYTYIPPFVPFSKVSLSGRILFLNMTPHHVLIGSSFLETRFWSYFQCRNIQEIGTRSRSVVSQKNGILTYAAVKTS
jgi:hypothetical protein